MIFVQKQHVYLVVLLVGAYLLLREIVKRRSYDENIDLSEVQIDVILETTNKQGDSSNTNKDGVVNPNKVEAKTNKDIDATIITTSSPRTTKKRQVCKIPVLNPFHPDITKFGRYSPKKPHCTYQWFSDVTDDGILMIRDEVKDRVKTAQFGYIQRVNKDWERISKMNLFYDQDKKGINDSYFIRNPVNKQILSVF